ncbi:hypothetical protein F5Y00DRAFT_192619 [Daldinia vernicosa]|uniref:uncharacterized protein n=1 Tax=Daldinia vernicosa TaxID=114800 RepID=UPI002008A7C8|nr:uncharacterized protein F5Y00DRAFT_192619 [Daldinia vernicosa]KAI0852278.1 hypothetical protein F5Y00DRAFT_192619 [Daldinia vernicosa]
MMNKFEGNNCPDFIQVRDAIQFLLKEGPNTLKRREKSEITQGPIESDMQAAIEEQRARLLNSLRFPSMNERKNDSVDSHEGTLRWIFRTHHTTEENYPAKYDNNTSEGFSKEISEDESNALEDRSWYDFEDWLKSDNTIYWISGKLRSGKTTLVKYLIENRLTKEALAIWAKDPVILSHFFWKAGPEKLQRNIKGCSCSILHQTVQSETIPLDLILTTYKPLSTKESVTDLSFKELKDVCFAFLRNYPYSICIFLDGLDEICLEDRSSLMELIEALGTFPNIKICVASNGYYNRAMYRPPFLVIVAHTSFKKNSSYQV